MKNALFITGACGTGKTTLGVVLKMLNIPNIVVIDVDDAGVPKDADEIWRQKRTGDIVKTVNENAAKNLTTIVCGVCVPTEVTAFPLNTDVQPVFGLLEISDDILRSRLSARGWPSNQIEDNVTWAMHLKRAVIAEKNHFVINTERLTPEQIAKQILARQHL